MESSGPIPFLYRKISKHEKAVGGGEGTVGIYGTICRVDMTKIMDALQTSCGMDENSTFVDMGAGIGGPLLHSMLQVGCIGNFGIEIDPIKVQKAEVVIKRVIEDIRCSMTPLKGALPVVFKRDMTELNTLDPATHAYSFWEGIPEEGKRAFGALFTRSRTCKAVVVVQHAMRKVATEAMAEYGFSQLELMTEFVVRAKGSSQYRAYVFKKIQNGEDRAPVFPGIIEDVATQMALPIDWLRETAENIGGAVFAHVHGQKDPMALQAVLRHMRHADLVKLCRIMGMCQDDCNTDLEELSEKLIWGPRHRYVGRG